MAHLSMQDDVPAPHVYRPFLITLCYNGRQQNLSRPESLSNVRNNATWTFNLPIDTLPDSIAIGYRVGRQTKTVTCEDDWTALRSQRKVKTFTVELVSANSSPALHFTEDSGFETSFSSPTKPNYLNTQPAALREDSWANDSAGGDAWGDATATFQTGSASTSADPWGASDAVQATDINTEATTTDASGESAGSLDSASSNPKEADSAHVWGEEVEIGTEHTIEAIRSTASDKDHEQDSGGRPVKDTNSSGASTPWGDASSMENPSKITAASSAWDDDGDDMTFATIDATSQAISPAVDDAWGGSYTSSFEQSSFTGAGRGRGGRGRGSFDRGRGRGRGRGGTARNGDSGHYSHNNNGSRERSGSPTIFRSPRNDTSSRSGNNQMFQAPDNGWKARTQRHHPYASPSYTVNAHTTQYDQHLTPGSVYSPIPHQSSFTYTAQDVQPMDPILSASQAYSSGTSAWSIQNDAQIPRQAPTPTIVDLFGNPIPIHQLPKGNGILQQAPSVPSTTVPVDKAVKSPWDD